MQIKKIETPLSSFEIFLLFKDKEYCFFLDSSLTHEILGRYSLIVFEPEITFSSKNGNIEIKGSGFDRIYSADPFEELKKLLENYRSDYDGDLPFVGGAVGYFGYDMCHHVEILPRTAIDDVQIPDCFFGIYDGAIIIDHFDEAVYAASSGFLSDAVKWVNTVEKSIENGKPNLPSLDLNASEKKNLICNMDKDSYVASIGRIKDYIKSGDIYQVNFTQRFEGECTYSPYELYYRLRTMNPAPFASYMDLGSAQIISSSPERFLQIKKGKVQTRPIKGTRARGKNTEEDLLNKTDLYESEKDRAELLMIVDLERNDLGKVCKTGSVKVTQLYLIEEYATVYHLVSTVEGILDAGIHVVDCIKSMFPGGSITGAPKIRSMEIIDELEPTQRNIYTGSIGYIGFNSDTDLNIVIRTIVQKGNKVYFQAGGGIVWDSDAQMEYDESLQKAKALMEASNTKLEG